MTTILLHRTHVDYSPWLLFIDGIYSITHPNQVEFHKILVVNQELIAEQKEGFSLPAPFSSPH